VSNAKENARKKWPHEILGAKTARKEALPTKPESLNYALFSLCTNMHDWLMLGALKMC